MPLLCARGYEHTVVVSNDGEVHSFGRNSNGQLGLGHNNNVSLPTPIPNLPKIMEISCGEYFTVCIDKQGELWSFGSNSNGQLGTGNTTSYNIPQKIKHIPLVRAVSCGTQHVLIITNDSNLWSCGRNDQGQLCLGNKAVNQSKYQQTSFEQISKISAGAFHSLFQNNKGEIFGCGQNCEGQVGLGHFNDPQIKVTPIPNLPLNIVQFCSGYYYSLFRDSKGNVFSTGYNHNGQLGLGHKNKQNVLNEKYQQINEKLNKKQEIENQITKDVKKIQIGLKEIFTKIEETKNVLEEMCSDVSKFCENENEMNEELSKLFTQKKFEEFDCSDVSKLLWKMDMVRYQSLFELNQINGFAVSLYDDYAWKQMGIDKRDCFYISFYFKMMKSPGYFKTFSDDYDPDCCVCSHNTPEKTIHLLKEYEIPIEDDFILKNNICSPLLTSKFLMKDILGNELFSQKGLETMGKLKKWKKIHKRHLKQLNAQ